MKTNPVWIVSSVGVDAFTDYYPFGFAMPGRQYITGSPYRFGYQGQFAEKDEETGLNHFEARSYDSRIGRWLTTDPANQDWSYYMSMGNNPVSRFDPDGRFWQELGNLFRHGKWRSNEAIAFERNNPGAVWRGRGANGYYTFDDIIPDFPDGLLGTARSKDFTSVNDFWNPPAEKIMNNLAKLPDLSHNDVLNMQALSMVISGVVALGYVAGVANPKVGLAVHSMMTPPSLILSGLTTMDMWGDYARLENRRTGDLVQVWANTGATVIALTIWPTAFPTAVIQVHDNLGCFDSFWRRFD